MAVTFTHSRARAATLEEPAEAEEFEVSSVSIGGVECITLFSDDDLDDLIGALEDEMEAEAADHAESRRDEA